MKIFSTLLLLISFTVFINGQTTSDKQIQTRNEKLGVEKLKVALDREAQDSIQLQELILAKQKVVAEKLETIIKLTIDVEEENHQIKLLQDQLKKRKEVLQLMFKIMYMAPEPTLDK